MESPRKKPLLDVGVLKDSFKTLPYEVQLDICSWLDIATLTRFGKSCSRLHALARESVEIRYMQLAAEMSPRLVLPYRNDYKNVWFRTRFLELRRKRKMKVATGIGHTVVAKGEEVYSFGEGTFGSLGLGSLSTQVLPAQIDTEHFLNKDPNAKLEKDKKEVVIELSCGTFHTALLTNHGKVYTSGQEEGYRLGYDADEKQLVPRLVPLSSMIPILQVSLGSNHGLLLGKDGHVYSFGNSPAALGLGKTIRRTTPRQIPTLSGINCIKVCAGDSHSMVLSDSGELFTFGLGKLGRLGHGNDSMVHIPKCVQYFVNTNTKICNMAGGSNFSLAIDDEGNIYSFGAGSTGRLGHSPRAPFRNELTPRLIQYFKYNNLKVADCTAGGSHSAVLTCGGHVYTFGLNRYGKLGLGDEVNRPLPTRVKVYKQTELPPSLYPADPYDGHFIKRNLNPADIIQVKFISVTAGDWHTILVSEDNEVYTFGGGWFGRLGHGNRYNVSVPTVVKALT